MCELVLAEYGLPPEYIFRRWTEEQLLLLVDRRNERVRMLNKKTSRSSTPEMNDTLKQQLGYFEKGGGKYNLTDLKVPLRKVPRRKV